MEYVAVNLCCSFFPLFLVLPLGTAEKCWEVSQRTHHILIIFIKHLLLTTKARTGAMGTFELTQYSYSCFLLFFREWGWICNSTTRKILNEKKKAVYKFDERNKSIQGIPGDLIDCQGSHPPTSRGTGLKACLKTEGGLHELTGSYGSLWLPKLDDKEEMFLLQETQKWMNQWSLQYKGNIVQ